MSEITFAPHDLSARIVELWRSGRQVLVLEGSEVPRYQLAIKNGAEAITKRLTEAAEADGREARPVKMVAHDRWCGFHIGLPDMVPCRDKKSNALANALQMAIFTREEITRVFGSSFIDERDEAGNPNPLKLPFDPADDLVFVFKSMDAEIGEQQLTQTLLRNIAHVNACSPAYVEDKAQQAGVVYDDDKKCYPGFTRGTRMLIFITPVGDFPKTIPELRPEIVPLPDYETLDECAKSVLEPLFEDYEASKGKKGAKRPTVQEWELIVNSGFGLTNQDFEEAISLAWTRLKSLTDIPAFLDIIEKEMVKALAKIPGLVHIPKEQIVNANLPGYEAVEAWVKQRMSITREQAKSHNITPMRGVSLGGIPGTGKTEFSKYLAKLTSRTGLLWNSGESKGNHVGDTEKTTRLVIQVARARRAMVLLDDIDKGSVAKSKNYDGDGGTGGNQVQMLLQEMSDPNSDVLWVFTFNRLPDLPELLRPGRMDKRFYVERPNAKTRLAILKTHIARAGTKVDSESQLELLSSDDLTRDWTGAELAHVLIKEEVVRSLAEGSDTLQVGRMCSDATGFTPLVRQKAFADDVADMEAGCVQFTKIGNTQEPAVATVTATKPTTTKSRRQTTI
ncbi:MAG: ATP-binding protein [Phycisphaerae bacterium]